MVRYGATQLHSHILFTAHLDAFTIYCYRATHITIACHAMVCFRLLCLSFVFPRYDMTCDVMVGIETLRDIMT
jgi:hypothetical protein